MQNGQSLYLGFRFAQILQCLKTRTRSELHSPILIKHTEVKSMKLTGISGSFIMCSRGERISLQDALGIRELYYIKIMQNITMHDC